MVSPIPTGPAAAISWPGRARAAAAVTFDVDAESALLHNVPKATAHRSALSQAGYDRVAVPAILEMYHRLGVRQTFFVPGWVVERYPWLAEAIVTAGHEVALHGYRHIAAHDLTPGEEAEDIERACAVLGSVLGRTSQGWRGPNYGYSTHTTKLLLAQGIRYDSTLMGHHLPYLIRSGDATLLELPVDWTNDDWPQYAQSFEFAYHMPIASPAAAMAVYRAEIAAAKQVGGLWIGVWHPFLSGRPSRLAAIADLVRELRDDDEIWLAPLHEIAAHVRDQIATAGYRPMIDQE
ncbi:polysaccharide deacetylase family protein [Nocardia sp. BMG111209]|uniref:polysaccharide deacetylase family protein n=1 Tax=Nocardia sp. BMG111209 TaxID=1160137 RepID=UPI000374B81B|nr:polysaccharide deacetylase family protein [Nocardia sp. BMG111209]